MVAAAKYARAERQLKPARVYGTGALGMCLHIVSHFGWVKSSHLFDSGLSFPPPVSSLLPPALYEKAEIKAPEEKAGKHLIIGVTSDRGLCGAIHSGVAKTIKSRIASLTDAGKEVMVVNVGDKLRGLLHR